MESELLDGIHQRFVRSFLDFVILLELSKRPLGGQDVLTLIHNRHHILLSRGTVYTCLYALEKEGLVKSRVNSGKTVFALTKRGEEGVREFLNAKTRILGLLLDLFTGE